jgi:hypothetical protein
MKCGNGYHHDSQQCVPLTGYDLFHFCFYILFIELFREVGTFSRRYRYQSLLSSFAGAYSTITALSAWFAKVYFGQVILATQNYE